MSIQNLYRQLESLQQVDARDRVTTLYIEINFINELMLYVAYFPMRNDGYPPDLLDAINA